MASWQEFLATAPAGLSEVARRRLDEPGVVLLGTTRRDGSPRITPVEPVFFDGELAFGAMWRSMKARDLLRDPRLVVHSLVRDREATGGDVKLRGRARAVEDPAARRRFGDAVFARIAWRPEEPFHAFIVEIESVALLRFDGGDMTIARWPST
ncbi:MAG: pyridoxamine 5'-phosphate oxidase family protein [Dehalococcoidia bacterium]|nr:pyridoxamine 5'-phosphate oxidase family protein [Dehalococcoidia bacterium]